MIVCLDANFAQKRRKTAQTDAAHAYAGTRFASTAETEAMEGEVDGKRKRRPRRRTKGTSARLHDDILDECEQSFTAAHEKMTKASKNYYADTGLMALLCRHDRVIYVVNMTSPGERQHYALTLLRKLMHDLPDDWRVGVLYDIACQLSRSIEKVRTSSFPSIMQLTPCTTVWFPGGICRSVLFWRVNLPRIRPSMSLSARLPPSQTRRVRPERWRRVRAVLERHPLPHPWPPSY